METRENVKRRRPRLSRKRRILLEAAAASIKHSGSPGTEPRARDSGDDGEAIAQATLQLLPTSLLLKTRKELALRPWSEALQELVVGDEVPKLGSVLAPLRDAGPDVIVRSVAKLLGPCYRCWNYTATSEEVMAGERVLSQLSHETRGSFLTTLRSRGSFCAAVRHHLGRADGRSLLRLGKARTAWLLGADADDVAVVLPESTGQERRARKRRRPSRLHGGWSTDGDSEPESYLQNSSDVDANASTDLEEPSDIESQPSTPRTNQDRETVVGVRFGSDDSSDGDRSETLAFLKAFRERRRQCQT